MPLPRYLPDQGREPRQGQMVRGWFLDLWPTPLPALLPPSAQGLLSAPLGLRRTHESTSGKCSELLREKSPEGPKVGTITNKHAHLLAPQFIVGQGGNAWGLALGLATNRCRQVATSCSPNSCKGDELHLRMLVKARHKSEFPYLYMGTARAPASLCHYEE